MTARPPLPIRRFGRDVPEEVEAARRAATAARRVVRALIASRAPASVLTDAAQRLEALAAELQPHGVDSRYADTDGLALGVGTELILEHHPFLGPSNPMAPPVELERNDDATVSAAVTYDLRHEGMPGHSHGGWIAALFDQVLAVSAAGVAGRPSMTGTMTIRFLRPTPIATSLHFEASAERTGERTLRALATLSAGDEVTAEAEGIMVMPRGERIGHPEVGE
jgi:acyl-coenzyme A thioesterase PaaI-like protein